MSTLRIYALGQPRVLCDQETIHFPTRKTENLLYLLLLHVGETLERDLIAEQLWPMRPSGKARRCLSTTLWRLRQTLECWSSPHQLLLSTSRSTLAFNGRTAYWFDVQAFEQQAALGLAGSLPCTSACRQALEKALDLYRGDLLEGCSEHWCLVDRERLRVLHLRVLRRVQRDSRLRGDFEAAISLGHQLLNLDPLQEDVHRELMRCHVEAGQRPLAVKQFQRCRETLHRELQIGPMTETRELYQRIRADAEDTRLPMNHEVVPPNLQKTLKEFSNALDALKRIEQTLQTSAFELEEAIEAVQDGSASGDRDRA